MCVFVFFDSETGQTQHTRVHLNGKSSCATDTNIFFAHRVCVFVRFRVCFLQIQYARVAGGLYLDGATSFESPVALQPTCFADTSSLRGGVAIRVMSPPAPLSGLGLALGTGLSAPLLWRCHKPRVWGLAACGSFGTSDTWAPYMGIREHFGPGLLTPPPPPRCTFRKFALSTRPPAFFSHFF